MILPMNSKTRIIAALTPLLIFAAPTAAQAWSGAVISDISCPEVHVTLPKENGAWKVKGEFASSGEAGPFKSFDVNVNTTNGAKTVVIGGFYAASNLEVQATVTVGNAANINDGKVTRTVTFVNCGKPQGTQGPAGPRGPEGPAGPKGEKGSTGEKGAKGDTGAPGKNGVDGTNGKDGAPGLPGKPGPAGPQGPAGAQGIATVGDTGKRGPRGRAGKCVSRQAIRQIVRRELRKPNPTPRFAG